MSTVAKYQEVMTRLIRGQANEHDHHIFHKTHQFYIVPRGSREINPVEGINTILLILTTFFYIYNYLIIFYTYIFSTSSPCSRLP